MYIIGVDPGKTTGIVGADITSRGIRITHIDAVEGYDERLYLPIRSSETEVVVEAPPPRPDDPRLPLRFEEAQARARSHTARIYTYRPADWKPALKRLQINYPGMLRLVHQRDAYGLILNHLRTRHTAQFPFLKEDGWYTPTK